MEEKPKCLNCGEHVIGNYCHHCGQKNIDPRLTWSVLFNDLQHRLFGFDNAFVHTVKDLSIAPGKVVKTYLKGNRVRYVAPVGYFFLLITIFVLLISFLDIDMEAYTKTVTDTMQETENKKQQMAQHEVIMFVFENLRIVRFLLVPFFIAATWVIFYNKRYNFLETAVAVFYWQAHPMLLSIFSILVFRFSGINALQSFVPLVTYLYFAIGCAAFYKGNKVWNFVKGLLSIALAYVLLILLILIGAKLLSLMGVI